MPFSFRSSKSVESLRTTDEPPPSLARTLLPAPLASLVSFASATGSLSLRLGGFIGHLAINTTRVGTLSGIELSRALLEAVLFRAGQDVVDSSTGELGRAAAESALASTLAMIHNTLTHTSFLVSAGFRLGSSSLSAGIGLSHALCTAIDAVLGDTETSKAIATIIVMMQREFDNPSTGIERVSLVDLLSGSITFILLQRWGAAATEQQLKDNDVLETVWDIVVVDPTGSFEDTALSLYEEPQTIPRPQSHGRDGTTRRSSFVSLGGEDDMLNSTFLDDTESMHSAISTRHLPHAPESLRPETAFKDQLTGQLRPGSSVKVTAQSVLRNTVTVEVDGDTSQGDIAPPPGYSLVSVQTQRHGPDGRRKFVFQNIRKSARRGSFDVPEMTPMTPATPIDEPDETPLEFRFPRQLSHDTETSHQMHDMDGSLILSPPDAPIKANDKRPRSPKASTDVPVSMPMTRPLADNSNQGNWLREGTGRKHSLKNSLTQRGTPYSKLVDFWKHGSQHRSSKSGADRHQNAFRTTDPRKFDQPAIRPPEAARIGLSRSESRTSMDLCPSVDIEQRPGSRESYKARSVHRRGNSSIYNLATNGSDTSLVLHADSRIATRDRLATSLNGTGRLAGQYPYESFAHNVARFARFSTAVYGSAFLRFMGAAADEEPRVLDDDVDHHVEHRSFSQYAGLPPSTILLSSFVDPEGGASLGSRADNGMPLIHFISVDHESRAVVLTCRGTLGFEDVLTDMTCAYDELHWRGKSYQVHSGMLASARRLLTIHGGRLVATLKAALEEFASYGLVLCGHSLGGGVAAVLGILMSQPAPSDADTTAFITASPSNQPPRPEGAPYPHPADALALTLPPNRPIHVYAYGPAATMSPALGTDTRGLTTTIVNNGDIVPYLCLGNLRDLQTIALAMKHSDDTAQVRARVWTGLKGALAGGSSAFLPRDWSADDPAAAAPGAHATDDWPWRALQSLRARMGAAKLVPPGEVFVVERRAVLQRLAFTPDGTAGATSVGPSEAVGAAARGFKPASHVRVTHVKEPAARFAELRFQGSMFLDHIPARYEKMLETLEVGIS